MAVTQSDNGAGSAQDAPALPAGIQRARRNEAVQRLQIGFFGLGAMLLIVALANIIMERAKESEAATVQSAAAPLINIPPPATPLNDPLVDAGVVPDMPVQAPPANPAPSRNAAPPVPDRGNGAQKSR